MATCPNRNLQSWKDLESLQGESLAMVIWDRFEGRPPEFFYTTKLEEGTTISKGFDVQTRFNEEQNNDILDSIIYMLMERKKQEDFKIGDHIGDKSTRGAIPNFFLQQSYETEDNTSPSLEVAERMWKKEQAYEKSVRENASQEEQDKLYNEWVSLMEEEGIYEINHPGREAFLDIYEFWNGGIITSGKTEQEIKADVALGNTDVVGWRELLANRMKLFGYSVSNIEQETEFATDEDILERIYSKSSMEEDPSKKLTGRMKELLATIPNKDINFLGFQTYLPVDQVYKELSTSFAGLQNFPEMLAQVETLALHKPQYSAVADFMMGLNKKDAATFSRVFAQSANEFLLIRVEAKTPAGDVVRMFNPNENRIERSIATTWKNGAVESNIAKPKAIYKVTEAGLEIDQAKAKKIAESWLGVRRGIAGADNVLSPQGEVSVPVQALTELLWNMGIYLGDPEIKEETANNLQQIVNTGIFVVDNGRRQKLTGRAAFNYIANREGKSLARLVSQFVVLSPDGTKVERTLKSVGSTVFESQGSTVRHIASFAPLFFDMKGDSFVNGKGKQIYPINLRHHLGQIFEVLGSATEDKTEMMDMYGSDRFFKPVDGRPEFDSLLYRLLQSDEYTQEFKAIDLDALKDVTIPDGTVDYENFSNSDSLRTRLIAYINSGNRSVGLVAIPVQSDRKKFTFFPFVRTKNLAGTRGGTYGITGMTKNDIILGMIAQDMMRIAHGRGILSNQVTEDGLPNPPKDLPLTYIKNLQSPQAMQFDGTLVGSEGNIPIVTDAKLESKTGEYFISDFIEEYLTTPEELKEIEPDVFNEIQTKINIMVERTNEYFLDQAKKLNEKITTQSITLPVEAREFGDRMTLLENYVFDEFMGRNEISKILRGSRAHVKDIQTFYKRIGHGTTPGMELALASDLNINGLADVDGIANYGMPDTFIEATFEDIRLNLNEEMRNRAIERANAIRDGLIEAGYDAEFAELLAAEYYPDEVEGTDAQGLISIDFYRDLMQGKGEWAINEEKAYDAYKAAPTGSKQFVYQEGFTPQGFKVGDAVPVYPQKPYYERNELVGGVVTTDSHKNSYHLLLEGETKNNPVKDNLRRRMEAVGEYQGLQRIGVANFVTAKKIKVNKVNTLSETAGALNNVEFNTVNSRGLRFPQEIPKKKASTTMFNRQVRKNTISNINPLHTYTLNAGLDTEIKISGQEMLDMYHAAIERKIKLEFAKVEKELGIDKIQKALAKQDVAAYNQSMIDFHKKLRDKLKDNNIERDLPTNYDAGLKIELDPAGRPQFKVPLDFPVYFEKYQRVILGMAINEAFKQKVPGMEAVQVAEIGGYAESGELEFYKVEKDKSGTARVVHMEVMVREDIARKFGLEPGQDLSTLPEELRRIIGYRIPNQGKSSTVIMKIKRILPANYAKAVIVPAQLTKLTGSDFDIDKMFLMFPEVRMTDAGPVKIRPPYEGLLGIPTTQTEIKPGVQELFESNPELATSVYETLGFNKETKSRLTVSQEGSDGFGYVLGLFDNNNERIGKIVYRNKTYLKDKGFPNVNELHLGFEEKYQGKGYFQDALIELLNYDDSPIFISNGRVINNNVFKAISKLDTSKLAITKLEDGFIITLNTQITPQQKQQAQQLYSQYLDTIFPDSKVKDIVYHGTEDKFEKFDIKFFGKNDFGDLGKGFYFAFDKSKIFNEPIVVYAVVDDTDSKQNEGYEIMIPKSEQIHILGSKQDIEGFKDFAVSTESITTETSIDKITDVSILNNIVLDIVEAVQSNLLHVNESMAPLDESTLPELVRQIEAKFPELQAPLEFASAEIETEMGIRNTIGRAMRGLWANFIAGHAVAAYGDITVNPMYELTLDGKPYSQLIGIAGQEVESFDKEVPINMIGSRYLSAAVDAAKKPYQYTLNDRTFTYPVESYWIAFSGDTKALHDFLNVPIIREFTDNFYTKYGAKPILMENALLDVIPKMYKDSLKQDRLRPSTPMSREELSDPFDLTPERQYELLLNFLKFREAGRSLSQMFKVIAPDSMDGMNSIDSIKSYRSRQNQFNPSITGEENQIFVNSNDPSSPVVDQFIGNNSVYGMQRGFSNLFLDVADMASKIFPMTVSPALDNLDTKIMDLTGNTQLNPEAHREIRRAAMLSLFASEGSPLREFFSESHLQSNYLNRESNLVTKLRDMKVKHPKLAQNLFIRKFVENNDNDLPETKVYLLDFDTSYQMTRFEKDAVTLAAYRLLKRPEEIVGKDASIEDRQSIINLAEDLLMNTLIVHGFKQTTGSYQDLIPVTFFTENRYARYNNPGERLGTAVDFFRKQLTAMYITDTFDNFATDFIRQNYTQSPGGYTLVQGIRKKETPNELVLNDKDKIRMYRNGYPIPFITITNSTTNETFLYASGHILTSGSVQGKYVKVNPLGVDGKLIEATNPDKSIINAQGLPLSSITMTSTSTGMTTNTGNIAATKEQQDIICR